MRQLISSPGRHLFDHPGRPARERRRSWTGTSSSSGAGWCSGAQACAVTSGSLPVSTARTTGGWVLCDRSPCDLPSRHAVELGRPCGPHCAGRRPEPCRRGGPARARGAASRPASTRAPNFTSTVEISSFARRVEARHRVPTCVVDVWSCVPQVGPRPRAAP